MFCNKCGAELVPGAAFCLKCGQPAIVAAEGPGARAFTVTFVRESQWFAINPSVKIVVDDRDEYRIGNGETQRIRMSAGTHSVAFKCGIRNKTIELTVQKDLTLRLKWNRLTGSLTVKE